MIKAVSKRSPLGFFSLFFFSLLFAQESMAVSMDFSGGFRGDSISIHDVSTPDSTVGSLGDDGGKTRGQVQTMHLRLKPRLIVNDQTLIYSEWHYGPSWGKAFGSDNAYQTDQESSGEQIDPDAYSIFSGREALTSNVYRSGSELNVVRAWSEWITDVGTLRVGRAPRHWGLGLVWDEGDHISDRFQSTYDVISMAINFGNFKLVPGWSKSLYGGTLDEDDDVTDIFVEATYDNLEEDLVLGLYWNSRKGGPFSAKLFDFYVKKELQDWSLKAEVPVVKGSVKSGDISSVAFAGEAHYKLSDSWSVIGKLGHAPGEETGNGETEAFWFHPNYEVGEVLFGREWRSIRTNPATDDDEDVTLHPFNKSVSNANYLSLGVENRSDFWTWNLGALYAVADATAKTGDLPFDYLRAEEGSVTSTVDQDDGLGYELFGGVSYAWNTNATLSADLGFFFPGDYYAYRVTDNNGSTSEIWTWTLSAQVNF
jgi:hypothetical protein